MLKEVYMYKWMKYSKLRLAIYSVSVGLLLSGCADLVVTDVHHESFIGPALQVKATVKNQGWVNASNSTAKIEIKPAGSSTFTRSAVAATPALNSGQQIEFPISTLSPTELPRSPGQCLELRVCADSADAVWEGWFWEGNNCMTKQTCQ